MKRGRAMDWKRAVLVTAVAARVHLALALEPVGVPELMRTFDGREVKDLATWEKVRRPELKRYFIENMFGVRPIAAEKAVAAFLPDAPDEVALDGKAVRKMIRIVCKGPYGELSFPVVAFIPRVARRCPVFLLIAGSVERETKRTSA